MDNKLKAFSALYAAAAAAIIDGDGGLLPAAGGELNHTVHKVVIGWRLKCSLGWEGRLENRRC